MTNCLPYECDVYGSGVWLCIDMIAKLKMICNNVKTTQEKLLLAKHLQCYFINWIEKQLFKLNFQWYFTIHKMRNNFMINIEVLQKVFIESWVIVKKIIYLDGSMTVQRRESIISVIYLNSLIHLRVLKYGNRILILNFFLVL